MDELVAALDAQTRELMQDEPLRIWREAQKTVLFVTHQINEAVLVLASNKLCSRRPPNAP